MENIFDTQIANLLRESRNPKKGAADKPKYEKPSRVPDALVLVVFEMTCLVCGGKQNMTNRALLLRFGNDFTRPKKWIYAYGSLQREILRRKENVEMCEVCFATDVRVDHLVEEGTR